MPQSLGYTVHPLSKQRVETVQQAKRDHNVIYRLLPERVGSPYLDIPPISYSDKNKVGCSSQLLMEINTVEELHQKQKQEDIIQYRHPYRHLYLFAIHR